MGFYIFLAMYVCKMNLSVSRIIINLSNYDVRYEGLVNHGKKNFYIKLGLKKKRRIFFNIIVHWQIKIEISLLQKFYQISGCKRNNSKAYIYWK